MRRWTKKEIEIIKKSMEDCEEKKFTELVDVISSRIDRDKRSIALKIKRTKELDDMRLEYRIFKGGEKKTLRKKIVNGLEIGKRYRVTKMDTSKWGESWSMECKLYDVTDRFAVFDVGKRKECFLWNCYGIDWRARSLE